MTGHDTSRTSDSRALTLSGGRTLEVRADEGGAGRDTIELKSRDGTLELRITMTPEGPMIHVKGGSLAVEAADAVSVACKRFDVQASGGISLAAGNLSMESAGEVRIRSQGQTHLDSEILHLNCGDRTGYPEPPAFVSPESLAKQLPGATAAPKGSEDCGCKGSGGCGCEGHTH